MSTTAAPTTVTEASTAASTSSRRSLRLRRVLVTLAALIGLTASGSALTAAPAHAAGTASVTVCFDNAWHFSVVGTPWTGDVYYTLYNPSTGRWQTQQIWRSPNGCVRFTVHAGYWTYFQAYSRASDFYLSSPATIPAVYAAGKSYHLGWLQVRKTLTFYGE